MHRQRHFQTSLYSGPQKFNFKILVGKDQKIKKGLSGSRTAKLESKKIIVNLELYKFFFYYQNWPRIESF